MWSPPHIFWYMGERLKDAFLLEVQGKTEKTENPVKPSKTMSVLFSYKENRTNYTPTFNHATNFYGSDNHSQWFFVVFSFDESFKLHSPLLRNRSPIFAVSSFIMTIPLY